MPLNLVFFGPPGAGKGTQADRFAARHGIPKISTGDMLRKAIQDGTRVGALVRDTLQRGALVGDDLIISIVAERLEQPDTANGFVLDGFPRTIPQAEAMREAGVPLDYVLEIDVPDSEIIARMSGRRVHLASGRTYHVAFNPPKVAGKDDVTGEDLIQRDDDKEETVKKRLDVYHSQTKPLVDYYSRWAATGDAKAPRYRCLAGRGKVEEIRDSAFKALSN